MDIKKAEYEFEQHLYQQYQKYAPEKNPFGDKTCTIKFEDISDNPQEWVLESNTININSSLDLQYFNDEFFYNSELFWLDITLRAIHTVKNTRCSHVKHVTPEVNESIAKSTNWETVSTKRNMLMCQENPKLEVLLTNNPHEASVFDENKA
ncbi:22728_t:CDS:2 [Gigaspora margarita]|uniref:22728_t:CDS:1 n=1 Tax=Gigaspora margarita TaxID=4874 RepID=A0ABN7U9V5_GIGMA|nr:22728_t:CDS:2 [Gigaspora margarita]